MKLYPSLVLAAHSALTEIFQQGHYADKVIERTLRSNPKWGSRDRAFIAETTYDCVRWFRLLATIVGLDSAAVATFSKPDFMDIIAASLTLKFAESFEKMPHFEFQRSFEKFSFKKLNGAKAAITERKIVESIPDWLDELGAAELGDERWSAEIAALNRPADVVLRCNVLKISVLDLHKKLNSVGIETRKTPLSTDALILTKRANVFQTDLFKLGFFEVQDAGSQLIAPFLNVEPSMRVVDACAGAGGKSLHLASLMNNHGKIISLDTEAWKLEELKKRARRNGIHIIETRHIDSTKVIKRLYDTADRLLLDVPCSGIGVLRRNPDAKWKLQADFLMKVRKTQADILQDYSRILRVGGQLVYATCSILPSENERQVEAFLAKNPNFKQLDERKISPNTEGFDGFYMARLERLK